MPLDYLKPADIAPQSEIGSELALQALFEMGIELGALAQAVLDYSREVDGDTPERARAISMRIGVFGAGLRGASVDLPGQLEGMYLSAEGLARLVMLDDDGVKALRDRMKKQGDAQ